MVEIAEKGRPLVEADIAALESSLGVRLPSAYHRFLLASNGGVPSPDVVDIVGVSGSPTDVQVFFGIDRAVESSNLALNFNCASKRLPNHQILPIACDSGGNVFCLDLSQDGDERIFYCDVNDPLAKLYLVARDIGSFLHSIRAWDNRAGQSH